MTDLATLQEKLEKARAEAEKLARQVEEQRAKQLADLPRQVGLSSVDELIKALAEQASPRLKGALRDLWQAGSAPRAARRPRPTGAAEGQGEGQPKEEKRRTRAVITDETRAEVKKLVEENKTGAEIASALGISLPSVQNIKKALGLVKKRK